VLRLSSLGQQGYRKESLRLDALNAPLLAELIRSVSTATDTNTPTVSSPAESSKDSRPIINQNLDGVAAFAMSWFSLAMDPVDEKYRRRMRGYSLISAAIVVYSLNADAFRIIENAQHDSAFRERIQSTARHVDSLAQRAAAETATVATSGSSTNSDKTSPPNTTLTKSSQSVADTARTELMAILQEDSGSMFGGKRFPEGNRLQWVIGILASTLLVSLGAPFWHDVLETLFGVKNRVKAQAEKIKSEALPKTVTFQTQDSTGSVHQAQITTGKGEQLNR
jgi:hypothetical protein